MEIAKLINEIMKTVVTAIVAIVLFVFVQHPGSILNKEATQEEIKREKAKLLIEANAIEDPERRNIALVAIKKVYEGNSFLDTLFSISEIHAETEQISNSTLPEDKRNSQCEILKERLMSLRKNLDIQIASGEIKEENNVDEKSSAYQIQVQLAIVQDAFSQACS